MEDPKLRGPTTWTDAPWLLDGLATEDDEGRVVMCPAESNGCVGSAFKEVRLPHQGWRLHTTWTVSTNDPAPSDGLALIWAPVNVGRFYGNGGGALGVGAAGEDGPIDATGLSGIAVELDLYDNGNLDDSVEPEAPHVAALVDGNIARPLAPGPAGLSYEVHFGRAFSVWMQSDGQELTAWVDEVEVGRWTHEVTGELGYVGMTASNGQWSTEFVLVDGWLEAL